MVNAKYEPVAGRWGRWIGAALLVDFVVVCTIKVSTGVPGAILWLSHIGLLVAALGFLRRSVLLITAALIGVFVLHTLWLADCITWLASGTFPLGVTSYLADADVWAWVATAHHFYLAPLLIVTVWHYGQCPRAALSTAVGLFACLTILSRALLDPVGNVNFAFEVATSLDWAIFGWVNRLPVILYLMALNAFVSVAFFLTTYLVLRQLCTSPTAPPVQV